MDQNSIVLVGRAFVQRSPKLGVLTSRSIVVLPSVQGVPSPDLRRSGRYHPMPT
jgi:hypothetical protein